MAYWLNNRPKLTSLTLKRPGLIGLLSRRTFLVSPLSTVFHYGMVLSLITGFLLEAMYLIGLTTLSLSGLFAGWAWLGTWAHGFFGLFTIIGFIGVLGQFLSNRYFRLASGWTFYGDAALITAISASGIVLLLEILQVIPGGTGWWPTIHIVSVITWLVYSLLAGGLVAHAFNTILYRFSDPRSTPAFQAFNTACGRCGKCIEVCPQYRGQNEKPEYAPSLKVRRYLSAFKKGAPPKELRSMIEEVYDCTLCGLCVSVCPYSFRHYDLYMEMLTQANSLATPMAQVQS